MSATDVPRSTDCGKREKRFRTVPAAAQIPFDPAAERAPVVDRPTPPSAARIARWWYENCRDDDGAPGFLFGEIGTDEPFCFRCGWLAPVADGRGWRGWNNAGGWLERAHLIDWRALRDIGEVEAANEPGNYVLLCERCHRHMPSFDVGEWADALGWVEEGDPNPLLVALRTFVSDDIHSRKNLPRGRARAERLSRRVNETLTEAFYATLLNVESDDPRPAKGP
ncbi:hypothetical protein [Actinomadura sp. DC4]|uniref:hypothetical protein n=1 Tax=Actinomadura sp. DC4 TaxID=3055069 RepID=UPI0025B2777C|nr:hypothetical protein [Actinomadura sp. DC4]MDN3352293.1 hypothetical protein [Actinomadura sp. DC4]